MPRSPLHGGIVRRLARLLSERVPPGCYVAKEDPMTCARSEPEPDLAVIRGDPENLRAHPTTAELVMEVAISTEEIDRRKAAIYAEAGVKEYWLIEPSAGQVTLWTEPNGPEYRTCSTFGREQRASSTVLPGFQVVLADLLRD